MMVIPTHVKVGPFVYAVEYQTPVLAVDNTRLLGFCDHVNQRIVLDNAAAPTSMFETFVHETVHAIDHAAGTELNEQAVARFSIVLAAFLIDNGYEIGARR